MNWLRELRIKQKMTGIAVSASAQITQQHYNFIENGKRRPSVPVAKRIAAVLGFDWTKFFDSNEQESKKVTTSSSGLSTNRVV